MRIENKNGHKLVCGHIYDYSQLKVGTTWASADASDRTVKITKLEQVSGGIYWVTYVGSDDNTTHEKDWFSFQCRYCLVVEDN
jgi:hypothetical protein